MQKCPFKIFLYVLTGHKNNGTVKKALFILTPLPKNPLMRIIATINKNT